MNEDQKDKKNTAYLAHSPNGITIMNLINVTPFLQTNSNPNLFAHRTFLKRELRWEMHACGQPEWIRV